MSHHLRARAARGFPFRPSGIGKEIFGDVSYPRGIKWIRNSRRVEVLLDYARNNRQEIHSMSVSRACMHIVVYKSIAFLINTLAYRILRILPKGDYRINPYHIELIAREIINTADIIEKRLRLYTLLNILKKTPYAWTINQIIKEIIGLIR